VAGFGGGLAAQVVRVPLVERPLLDARRPGGGLAGPLAAADDLPHPLGGDAVLAAECGEREAGVVVGEDAVAEVLRIGTHGEVPPGRNPL
jgi:hypothetical protein